MAARGLNNSYGARTEHSISRGASQEALAGSLANKLYKSGKTSADIASMHPQEFDTLTGTSGVDPYKTSQFMRVHENYRLNQ